MNLPLNPRLLTMPVTPLSACRPVLMASMASGSPCLLATSAAAQHSREHKTFEGKHRGHGDDKSEEQMNLREWWASECRHNLSAAPWAAIRCEHGRTTRPFHLPRRRLGSHPGGPVHRSASV